MAVNTKIQWTDHTFNPWRGCQKVAAGCTNCYADAQAKRNPGVLGIWGPNGTRVIASEDMWRQPVKWYRAANRDSDRFGDACQISGDYSGTWQRPRVFCASLADVFEDWDGQCKMSDGSRANNCYTNGILDRFAGVSLEKGKSATTLNDVRARLFKLIDATPNLDWQLLTKRPENIRKMLVPHSLEKVPGHVSQNEGDGYHIRRRDNLWLGTSIAEQADADRNIPLLLQCRDLARVLFLSIEPLIGPVSIQQWLAPACSECHANNGSGRRDDGTCAIVEKHPVYSDRCHAFGPQWVIVGGESGPHARPCHVDWIRSIVDQCKKAGVPVFVKQLGSEPRPSARPSDVVVRSLQDSKGGDPDEWPEDLRVREFPTVGVPT